MDYECELEVPGWTDDLPKTLNVHLREEDGGQGERCGTAELIGMKVNNTNVAGFNLLPGNYTGLTPQIAWCSDGWFVMLAKHHLRSQPRARRIYHR